MSDTLFKPAIFALVFALLGALVALGIGQTATAESAQPQASASSGVQRFMARQMRDQTQELKKIERHARTFRTELADLNDAVGRKSSFGPSEDLLQMVDDIQGGVQSLCISESETFTGC